MSEAAYFPESWPLIFDFFDFFYFITCWIRIQNPVADPDPVPVPLCQKVMVPAVPVLAQQHWGQQFSL
jgi:hypothetical protein